MDVRGLIGELAASGTPAGCPHCRRAFPLSEYLLFDGRAEFPPGAREARDGMARDLERRMEELSGGEARALDSEKRAASIGLGKALEKMLPAHRGFRFAPSDCRFISEPIDMIVFEGLTEGRVDRIVFMDVKTGSSSLNGHQRQVRDAVEGRRVECKSY